MASGKIKVPVHVEVDLTVPVVRTVCQRLLDLVAKHEKLDRRLGQARRELAACEKASAAMVAEMRAAYNGLTDVLNAHQGRTTK